VNGLRGLRALPVGILRLYQRLVSPYLGPCCRFAPSCSEYMAESIALNGVVIGLLDGLRRLAKCHPFHPGGFDPPRRIAVGALARRPWRSG